MYGQRVHVPHHIMSHHVTSHHITCLLDVFVARVLFKAVLRANLIPLISGS